MRDAETLVQDVSLGLGPPDPAGPLFDMTEINLSARRLDRAAIERVNPHRGVMSLLDWIVWASDDFSRGIALKHVGHDEFWRGDRSDTFPESLLVEAGAQLACFLYNTRMIRPKNAAFLRLEDADLRGPVRPGDDLFILCADVRFSRRRFVADVQGMVGGRAVFDGRITGMGI